MKNIGEDGWNGGDSGDIGHTHDIKPLAYQQETPRSATSVQSEKPSQTTAWRPPSLALVWASRRQVRFWWSEAWTTGIVLRRIKFSATSCPSG
ncbi:hypothetical protein GN958_ATG09106 [Phytophthora infestans]|uniref:Uncharacterized protein n=1 Tax=Phytophthora infestans TaxID=4787 RepID=A0A8S9UU20_PHYIN|nr:hypothetical protein GN958_ATG09106 [Phytophthora infestans]